MVSLDVRWATQALKLRLSLSDLKLLITCLMTVNAPNTKTKEFGGLDTGDDRAALLDSFRKPFDQFALGESVREFDFRQYLFSRQAQVQLTLCLVTVVVCSSKLLALNSLGDGKTQRDFSVR